MMPESDDNYGGDFCSMLCLKTSPTIVILATKGGRIYHCILLDSQSDDDSQLEVRIPSIFDVLIHSFIAPSKIPFTLFVSY